MRELREAREREKGIKPVPATQEPPPTIFPDLMWVWEAFCFLSERRGVGANGPVPITVEAMSHYLELTGRKHYPYVNQVLRYVPILDREYLKDFYDKQAKEFEKSQRKSEQRSGRNGINRG